MAVKQTEEFRREPVRIALTSGLPRGRVASDLDVGQSTLSHWISQYRPTDDISLDAQTDLAFENERLRRENRFLREEREILKKATQFFASRETRGFLSFVSIVRDGPSTVSAGF
ncbi:transposase [Neokomagataea thailandica NBRC 106555]|uniref:Transposase n=2 Tax=Neokomagataea TaxID=1223423 RepID=A0A4Y6VAE5_9PROT|nr:MULTISPECIES: transposase [Neokomagataea]QDH25541.1 hypothetical protein D5366_10320 [Neokomagataea tanensis]GBR55618.1 transposase [Neokomagataea thailandica NBRC 106555]